MYFFEFSLNKTIFNDSKLKVTTYWISVTDLFFNVELLNNF
jgi:hypothetical protein